MSQTSYDTHLELSRANFVGVYPDWETFFEVKLTRAAVEEIIGEIRADPRYATGGIEQGHIQHNFQLKYYGLSLANGQGIVVFKRSLA